VGQTHLDPDPNPLERGLMKMRHFFDPLIWGPLKWDLTMSVQGLT